jgi:hypothetical protein
MPLRALVDGHELQVWDLTGEQWQALKRRSRTAAAAIRMVCCSLVQGDQEWTFSWHPARLEGVPIRAGLVDRVMTHLPPGRTTTLSLTEQGEPQTE